MYVCVVVESGSGVCVYVEEVKWRSRRVYVVESRGSAVWV